MSAEIILNIRSHEARAAIVEEGLLQEIFIERPSRRGLVGNIYRGKVSRVLPGMQAAFVEAGLARTAFLHADDVALSPGVAASGTVAPRVEAAVAADIRRLLAAGDDVTVQVVKDPIGGKGARVSTLLSLPSRYLVFMPRGSGIGVSARISDEPERLRLREALTTLLASRAEPGGYIVRTAAVGASNEQLAADLAYLDRLWTHVRERAAQSRPGELVHADLPLPMRLLRDELTASVRRVLVDDPRVHEELLQFARDFIPDAESRIELYSGSRPLFDLHAIEEEIRRALERKVSMKSGGHLVIDQTESMTTIDVNTGAFVGSRDLEDTIFRTNLEAAVAIARQLRLRNIGGVVIIDFIDMSDEAHRNEVTQTLQRSLAGDRAQTHVASLSPLGLVEMTRKRTRDSLEHLLCQPCPSCDGRGFVRTAETVSHDIFREIVRQARQFPGRELLILAHQDVIDRLLGEEAEPMGELSSQIGRPIRLQIEALYEVDQYDVVIM